MQEAEDAAVLHSHGDTHALPVACIRRHGGEDLVCMRPEHFGLLLLGFRGFLDSGWYLKTDAGYSWSDV